MLTKETDLDIKTISNLYYNIGGALSLGWLRIKARDLNTDNPWEEEAVKGLIDHLYEDQTNIVIESIRLANKQAKKDNKKYKNGDIITLWRDKNSDILKQYNSLIDDLKSHSHINLAMLITIEQRLRGLIG